jgi:fatty acid desaturase
MKGKSMDEDKILDIIIFGAIAAIIILKITNVITISWLWLAMPLILSGIFVIVWFVAVFIALLLRNKGE